MNFFTLTYLESRNKYLTKAIYAYNGYKRITGYEIIGHIQVSDGKPLTVHTVVRTWDTGNGLDFKVETPTDEEVAKVAMDLL
jgi:hypothetical protein